MRPAIVAGLMLRNFNPGYGSAGADAAAGAGFCWADNATASMPAIKSTRGNRARPATRALIQRPPETAELYHTVDGAGPNGGCSPAQTRGSRLLETRGSGGVFTAVR